MTAPVQVEGAIYQPDGAAVARVGQTSVLDFQIGEPESESGTFVPAALDGRFFVQRILGRAGELLAQVEPTRPDDRTVRFVLPITAQLLADGVQAADLTHAIVELLDDGDDEVLVRPFSIRRQRSGMPAATLAIGPAERLLVRYVGAAGLSAAQQAKDAGLIETATGDALATWLRAPAVDAAAELQPILEQAQELIAETVGTIAQAGAAQVGAVAASGAAQVGAVNAAGAGQVDVVAAAGATQTGLVAAAGATQVGAVNAAGAIQTNLLQEAARDASVFEFSYPNSAATAVPRGVTGVVLTAPGSGYTNGLDYVGTVTGGGGAGARFLFDVVGGQVTNIHGIEPGYGYATNPTAGVFTAAGAGNGATATITASALILSGQFYWAATANASTFQRFQNLAGVATAVVPAMYRAYAAQLPAAATASSSILWNITPEVGFVATGLGQKIRCIAPGANGAGALEASVAGLFGNVRVPVLLPDGTPVPQGTTKPDYPMEVTPAVIGGQNRLILTFPQFQQQLPSVFCIATGTAGAPILTLSSPALKYPANFEIDYEFEAAFDANGNGITASVRDSTGATILATLVIRDRDGLTTPPAGRWFAGDRLKVRRTPAGIAKLISVTTRLSTRAEAMARTSDLRGVTPLGLGAVVDEVVAPMSAALIYAIPNAQKKIVAFKRGVLQILMRTPMKYGAGVNPGNSDYAEYEMMNVGGFQTPVMAQGWALNSIRKMVDGRLVLLSHFSFESLVQSTYNTGLGPATMEFAWQLGEGITGASDATHPFVGFGHGLMQFVSAHLYANGSGVIDYAVAANFPVGTAIWCDSFSFQQQFNLLTVGGAVACRTALTTDFVSNQASGCCRVEHESDFGHADVTAVNPSLRNAYGHMLPSTGCDMVKAIGAAAVDIIADPDGNVAHGKKTQWAHYRSTNPTSLVELILAYGVPMRIGNTGETLTAANDDINWSLCDPGAQSLTIHEPYGEKTYVHIVSQPGGSTSATSMAGRKVKCQGYYRVKEGLAA